MKHCNDLRIKLEWDKMCSNNVHLNYGSYTVKFISKRIFTVNVSQIELLFNGERIHLIDTTKVWNDEDLNNTLLKLSDVAKKHFEAYKDFRKKIPHARRTFKRNMLDMKRRKR